MAGLEGETAALLNLASYYYKTRRHRPVVVLSNFEPMFISREAVVVPRGVLQQERRHALQSTTIFQGRHTGTCLGVPLHHPKQTLPRCAIAPSFTSHRCCEAHAAALASAAKLWRFSGATENQPTT